MRLKTALVAALFSAIAAPGFASADGFRKVEDRSDFVSLIAGKELRIGLFGIRLKVMPDGQIDGEARGWGVTGTWSWQDGYFCREMDWSGTPVPYNCQLVEVRGNQMRFTVDRGSGDDATFNLR